MLMDLVVTSLVLVAAAAIDGAGGDTMVSGTVFCDQCKDGDIGALDYPLGGVRVLLACPGEAGQFRVLREETTNWLGAYTTSFTGTPDMGNCRAQISGNGPGCGVAAGPAQDFRLTLKMFNSAMYTVEPLIAQPSVPSPFCRRSSASPEPPIIPPPLSPPPLSLPPLPFPQPFSPLPPLPTLPPLPSLPPLPPVSQSPVESPLPSLPPLPPLPPMPPVPFFEASACPYQMWMMPQHRCYWSVLNPNLQVSLVFGPLASTKYGTNITLRESMSGRGDPYRTLLREGITALLNSYASIQFVFKPVDVVTRVNLALLGGSTQEALATAFRFIKANSGEIGNTTCKFSVCA